jgi:hypothetical protein
MLRGFRAPERTRTGLARRIARERIAKGEPPGRSAPPRSSGGRGTGQLCDLCGKPMRPGEIEYAVEHRDEVLRTLHFHLIRRSVWRLECARADPPAKHIALQEMKGARPRRRAPAPARSTDRRPRRSARAPRA